MALGQRHYLSHLDIARVNRLYKCSQTGMELGKENMNASWLVLVLLFDLILETGDQPASRKGEGPAQGNH